MSDSLSIQVIDCRQADARVPLDKLREKLSPRGDIVSEAGRQRTIEAVRRATRRSRWSSESAATSSSADSKPSSNTRRSSTARNSDETSMRVTEDGVEAAHAAADPEYLATVRRIRDNVREFQEAILSTDVSVVRENGDSRVELRQRYLPLERVGICVPGGVAAYPSTLLMTAVPAQTAGVKEIAVVAPPSPFGGYNNDLLAACHELGVREVYRLGGAQAVAALAYGVSGIRRVDKIVGPGNLFVALAKRHVFGEVDIDSIAGPSEVIVLADESARPEFVAADLISQAEHSPGSGVLITWHEPLIAAVQSELERQLALLPRRDLAREALNEHGALILAQSEAEAAELTDLMAPEHLHISADDPEQLLGIIQNAGAIFLGHHTPVALGDYIAGPSHVLPTGGTARFANGLCSNDFLKRSSVIWYNQPSLSEAAADVRLMAAKEGLTAHSSSVDIRLS